MSDRIAVMEDGEVRQCGSPEEVYERPGGAFVAGFIGISNLLPGPDGTRAPSHVPSEELAEYIKRHVRERHSAYAYPRVIVFVDDLPKTLTGKIRRIELRERELQR